MSGQSSAQLDRLKQYFSYDKEQERRGIFETVRLPVETGSVDGETVDEMLGEFELFRGVMVEGDDTFRYIPSSSQKSSLEAAFESHPDSTMADYFSVDTNPLDMDSGATEKHLTLGEDEAKTALQKAHPPATRSPSGTDLQKAHPFPFSATSRGITLPHQAASRSFEDSGPTRRLQLSEETGEQSPFSTAHAKKYTYDPDEAPLPLVPMRELLKNKQAGELFLMGLAGKGGVGCVYRVIQRSLSRMVAIKHVNPASSAESPNKILLHEGIITGYLSHSNIIPLHTLREDEDGLPVLVMKYVEGVSWAELLKDDKHPFWERTKMGVEDPLIRHIEILIAICKAVEYAHSKGILHRDIKPGNVMIGEYGEVYLLDWGIAKPIEGVVPRPLYERLDRIFADIRGFFGTPVYMAPEMFDDYGFVDERTDVYLLGGVLHEIMTGQPPHYATSIEGVFHSVIQEALFTYEASVPSELASLCQRALHPKKEHRPQSAEAFRIALVDYLKHLSSIQLSDTAMKRLAELQSAQQFELSTEELDLTPGAVGEVHRTFMECRYGFLQALREWPENPNARAGLAKALEYMFLYEIDSRNYKAARGLFMEMEVPEPRFEVLLNQLKFDLSQEREERIHYKKIKHENDLSIGGRQHVQLMMGMAVLAALFIVMRFVWGPPQDLASGYRRAITFAGVATGGLLLAIIIGRDYLLVNDINRRFTFFAVLCCTSVTVNRLIRAILVQPIESIYFYDLMILGCLTATAGVTIRGWLSSLSVVLFLGALFGGLFPQQVYAIMAISFAICWLLAGLFLQRENATSSLSSF
ncbi:MAG TPA: hypothetical protein DCE42_12330 [Myxococcales bacterium]|nr:hypothetical protein [Deltaproteobacteria bacterium]HAA55539.1 hypothetical protein [Myxococcales bacterium]|tara:strand:+ start:7420 stop:9849 length:2430 start_codon:yes stop_codon:yes gene_type:complete